MFDGIREPFLQLVRLGTGKPIATDIPEELDWDAVKALADVQGLSAVVLDGLHQVFDERLAARLPEALKLAWTGEVLKGESRFTYQKEVAKDMAILFHQNGIRTYVLKGLVIAECYPKPFYRVSSDMDCFLLPDQGDFDAWSLGNDLIREKHFNVGTDYYKNSAFKLPGLVVENHRFMTPFRGNERLASFERVLQAMLREDKGEDVFEGTWLYRPPVMVSALFLIEHAYSHFLHEGLTWRMVLDWVLFQRKHENEIDWTAFHSFLEEFGFKRFYNSFSRLGRFLMGEMGEEDLEKSDRLMLEDIWAPLDVHETLLGVKGKLALAGNTWRARWKYRNFAEISWIRALWIQVKGFLFLRHPGLD